MNATQKAAFALPVSGGAIIRFETAEARGKFMRDFSESWMPEWRTFCLVTGARKTTHGVCPFHGHSKCSTHMVSP
jgi:hypothetical protein